MLERARDEIVALRKARHECERQFQQQVAEVGRLLDQLHEARDEIVALRETVERQRLVLSKGHAETRDAALEEAAQFIEEQQRRKRIWLPFGDAIRALKDRPA